jgi:hypothetical protein
MLEPGSRSRAANTELNMRVCIAAPLSQPALLTLQPPSVQPQLLPEDPKRSFYTHTCLCTRERR